MSSETPSETPFLNPHRQLMLIQNPRKKLMERLTISRRSSILDVWQGYGYSSGFRRLRPIFWRKLFESRECELELTELFIRMTKFQLAWRFHCAESVQILSYFWSLFSCISAEYGDYSVNLRIQSKHRKMRTRNNSVFGSRGFVV